MQTRSTFFLFWMVIAALWLSACATPPPASEPETEPEMSNVTFYPGAKLIIGSSELLGAVILRKPIFRNVGQLTQAQVELVNYSNLTLDLEYRIDWSDRDGFKVGATNSWQFISLSANGSEDLTSTGKVPEAKDIVVTVRLPDQLFEQTSEQYEPEQ